jgi:hypothetical protein
MSNYTKAVNFSAKDTLPVGDAQKKIKGSEIDTEFNAIATAVATKAEKAGSTTQSFTTDDLTVSGDIAITGNLTYKGNVALGNVLAWATWGTTGTVEAGEGLTVDWPSTGWYDITLDTAQADEYSYAASASTQQDPYSGEIDTYTSSTFRVRTYNGTALNSQPTRLLVVG